MNRQIMWAPWEGPGLEHLRLTRDHEDIVADGVIIGMAEQEPFRMRYTITCDDHWRMRAADVISLEDDRHEIRLRVDGAGRWTTAAGEPLPNLAGCLEVDISATPFTNTLPIRRLALGAGQARDVAAAYIAIPAFTVEPVPQRYTLLDAHADRDVYCYEGLRSGFRADLPVDGDGVVTDYPGVFKRVWTWQEREVEVQP